MSEYWVSNKKYFCKYCDIYIADDAPSRQHHENGMRHKGNVERFIRGLYKSGEKKKKDAEEEKREMARVERAAQAAYAADVGAGHAKATPSAQPALPSSSTSTSKAQPKPVNKWANYTTAASLGYTDPDVERAKAEAERKNTMGVVGDWQVYEVSTAVTNPDGEPMDEAGDVKIEQDAASETATSAKRPAEAPVDEEDGRAWKLRKKTFRGLGADDEIDAIPIKVKKKEELPVSGEAGPSTSTNATIGSPLIEPMSKVNADPDKPKWTKIKWKKAVPDASTHAVELDIKDEPGKEPASNTSTTVASPSQPSQDVRSASSTSSVAHGLVKAKESAQPKLEDVSTPVAPSTGLFRKRKGAPVGAGKGRRDI